MSHKYALSSPQEAIYIDSLLYEGTTKYNMGGFSLIRGRIDPDLFIKAHRLALQVHDTFTTKLEFTENGVEQSTGHEPYSPVFTDISSSETAYRDAIDSIMADFARPIPIDGYPLAADTLFKITDELFVWYPKFHHIINDGFGHLLFTDTLTDYYTAMHNGDTLSEKEIRPYRDFVEEDAEHFGSASFQKGADFWNDKFENLPEPLPFNGSKKGLTELEQLKTERLTLTLSRLCYNDMLRICDENSITTFHYILAIMYAYLYRTKGLSDIVLGMPILNRNNKKFRNTSGMFMSMMPLRICLDGTQSFLELAQTVNKELRACYRYQRYPLGQIIKECRTKEGFTGNLFDITVVYRKLSYNKKFGESPMNMFTLDTHAREEVLSVEIDEYDDGDVNIFFNYNPNVIPEYEANHLVKGFEAMFLDTVLLGDKPLEELRIMPERDSCALFGEKVSMPDKRFEELFRETAEKAGDAHAVKYKNDILTYSELNTLSDSIAATLAADYGINKGDNIVCLIERDILFPGVILGIFKTGAVYVPADVSFPKERIEFILKDSGAACLITDKNFDTAIPVYIPDIKTEKKEFASKGLTPDDVAYIIYTSGTTGQPKGVAVPHRGIVNTVLAQASEWGVDEGSSVLQFASLSFDASMSETGMALLYGAILKIASKEEILEPAYFTEFMEKERIEVATLPPSYLNSLDGADFMHLKTLITAGESPVEKDVRRYKDKLRYINAYGPTEISVCAGWHEVSSDYQGGKIPIGKPIANASIYILDKKQNPLPPGCVGEICVGGLGVALGYVNRPELNEDKFVNDPFYEGSKMYLTGDTGRLREDGNIVFTGRKDSQVKIRGFRVEPEEISRTMETLPFIDSAIADVYEKNGSRYIAVYYTSEQQQTSEKIADALAKKLPQYMIPSLFIHIDSFPLNSSGKIDQKALPEPYLQADSSEQHKTAETDTEKTVASLWANILQTENFGTESSFFELGGHSLHAVKVMAKIQKATGVRVSLREFFAVPTVKGIASVIDKRSSEESVSIPAMPAVKARGMTPSEKRVWVFSCMEGGSSAYNMPLLLDAQGDVDTRLLSSTFTYAAKHHEALRTCIDTEQAVCKIENIAEIKVETVYTDDIKQALKAEAAAPFTLIKAPLIRVKLFRSDQENVLSVVMHHIISDGWSLQLLMEEVLETYSALRQKREPQPNREALSLTSYAEWLKSEQYCSLTEKDRNYWLNKFTGEIPELELPTDFPRGEVLGFNGSSVHRITDIGWPKLEKAAAELNITPYTLLLSALYGLLGRLSGNSDIVIGSPVSGRSHPDLQNTLGIFINIMPLRVKFNITDSFITLAARTKTASAEGHDHQLYPFDMLVNELNPERKTNRQPLFDVMMILQDTVQEVMTADGLTLTARVPESSSSLFDMTFFLSSQNGTLRLDIEYNIDLFRRSSAERIAEYFEIFLSGVLKNREKPVSEIPYISETEEEFIRKSCTGAEAPLYGRNFLARFAENGAKFPDRTAVVTSKASFTYGDISKKAMGICAELRKRGVKAGDAVALKCGRNEALASGMLGIMMSGAVYVFLSEELPTERMVKNVQSAGVKYIISDSVLPVALKNISIDYRSVEECFSEMGELSENSYIIFTSGTTGEPKGAVITRRNLENLVLMTDMETYEESPDVLKELCAVSGAFDVSVKQVCSTLSSGHTLHLADENMLADPYLLLEFIKDNQINILDMSPSLLSMLFEAGLCRVELAHIKKLLTGSEAVPFSVVTRFLDAHPQAEVYNCYGPSECTVESVKLKVNRERVYPSILPIGRPSVNTRLYILDNNMNICPVGVPGNIFLGGECVGGGYLNINSGAFAQFNKERVYSTGDIGKLNEFGDTEFCGRKDSQIKIRGYRIEPAEVENALISAGAVSAAVIAFNKTLAAFYTGSIEEQDIRKIMGTLLPSYSVPSVIKRIEKIPLTPGGKTDRRSLEKIIKETDSPPVLSDGVSREIYHIWASLLGNSMFSEQDIFFDAGGSSVLLVQLHSRLNNKYPGLFRLAELFSLSTVDSQAQRVRKSLNAIKTIKGVTLPQSALSSEASGVTSLTAETDGKISAQKEGALSSLMYLMYELYGHSKGFCAVAEKGRIYISQADIDEAEDMAELTEACRLNMKEPDGAEIESFIPIMLLDGSFKHEELAERFGIAFDIQQNALSGCFSGKIKAEEAKKMTETLTMILKASEMVI